MPHSRRASFRVMHSARTLDPTLATPDDESIITKLGKRVVIMGDCWIVDGEPNVYPKAGGQARAANAHRFVYCEIHAVVVPTDIHIHHTCEHPGCIRPDHLVALTAGDHQRVHQGSARLEDVAIPPDDIAA